MCPPLARCLSLWYSNETTVSVLGVISYTPAFMYVANTPYLGEGKFVYMEVVNLRVIPLCSYDSKSLSVYYGRHVMSIKGRLNLLMSQKSFISYTVKRSTRGTCKFKMFATATLLLSLVSVITTESSPLICMYIILYILW